MFVGRKKELEYLEENYKKNGNQILVLYGHKGVGKTSLMFRFACNKSYDYYHARPCSFQQQIYFWQKELGLDEEMGNVTPHQTKNGSVSYEQIFAALDGKTSPEKKVLIIDEFQNIVKYSPEFMTELMKFLKDSKEKYMVLLASSSISFVENALVSKIGSLALGISGFFKIPPLKFSDCVTYFKNFSTRECMEVYGILGGIPAYWARFTDKLSLQENMERCILHPDSALFEEGMRIISEELREVNVYCTILSCLAEGKNKLNELHVHTGFSRAKISVYLKNLMQLELVEKVFSFDNASNRNAKKGVYRIGHSLLLFYFKYMYGNYSALKMCSPRKFYEEYVQPDIGSFYEANFKKICMEYLELLMQKEKLPIQPVEMGEWVGKEGSIDIVLQNEDWDNILCFCNWKKPVLELEDFIRCMEVAKKARLTPDYVMIFSAGSFEEELVRQAKEVGNIELIDINLL